MVDRHRYRGVVIIVSDRCVSGERQDRTGPAAAAALTEHHVEVTSVVVIPEGREAVAQQLRRALEHGADVVLTAGGTGIGPRNYTPEATAPFLSAQLPGVVTQILLAGLESTPKAGLSRGLVGVTDRGPAAALIVNAPGSTGGVRDAVGVIGPLLPHILEREAGHAVGGAVALARAGATRAS